MKLESNQPFNDQIAKIAEIAGYLWEKGWAERNGGNISVNITDMVWEEVAKMNALAGPIELPVEFKTLADNVFYVTGTGKRMRYVAQAPFENGSVIRINSAGTAFDIVAFNPVMPTSELPSHLAMHNYLRENGVDNKVVLHTHPTSLIALSHCEPFLKPGAMTRMLWSMIPECRVIVPRGVGIIPYCLPGSMDLAWATISQLDKHDMVLWEKHGILAVGDDLIECFDKIDTLDKSAQIYLMARTAGCVPQGMTNQQLDELVPAFGLPTCGCSK